jgi:GntR family transcriptional regulator, transcriptional repressor for pyruvate dehydrogenase complex
MSRPAHVEHQRIAEEVAEKLRALILSGHYQPGDKLLPERKLAVSLGVNRATLREALKNLEQLGLVRSRHGDGTRVLSFVETAGLELLSHLIPSSGGKGIGLLRDVLEFRQIVGRELARLAAGRAEAAHLRALEVIAARTTRDPVEAFSQDLDFYNELARATGNILFVLLLNPVRTAVGRFSSFFQRFNPPVEEVRAHHREILEALARKDGEAAALVADRHLRRGKDLLLARLEQGFEVVGPAADGGGPEVGVEAK